MIVGNAPHIPRVTTLCNKSTDYISGTSFHFQLSNKQSDLFCLEQMVIKSFPDMYMCKTTGPIMQNQKIKHPDERNAFRCSYFSAHGWMNSKFYAT